MRFIGITGGIGAGKSEILNYLSDHFYCEIYFADEVAHLVKKAGTPCFDQLIELMGTDLIGSDGEIDKNKMADKIFGEEGLLEKVNALVHPAVKEYLLEHYEQAKMKQTVELFFVEAALLVETGYGELLDEMWYIYADPEIRRERLFRTRGYSDEKITRIMGNQLSDEAFRKACDFVIDNSGSLQDSFCQIDKRLSGYTRKDRKESTEE